MPNNLREKTDECGNAFQRVPRTFLKDVLSVERAFRRFFDFLKDFKWISFKIFHLNQRTFPENFRQTSTNNGILNEIG